MSTCTRDQIEKLNNEINDYIDHVRYLQKKVKEKDCQIEDLNNSLSKIATENYILQRQLLEKGITEIIYTKH